MNNFEMKNFFTEYKPFVKKNKYAGIVKLSFKTSDRWSAGVFIDLESNTEFRYKAFTRIEESDEEIVINGSWEIARYNGYEYDQFVIDFVEKNLELTQNGLYVYLKDITKIKGLGPAKAKAISEKFYKDFNNIITNNPDKIVEELGISEKIIYELRDLWIKDKQLNLITTKLSELPIPPSIIPKLINSYWNNAYEIVSSNPYNIIGNIERFTFNIADEIAIFLGLPLDSPNRINAAIDFILNIDIQTGWDGSHCWIEFNDLLCKLSDILRIDTNIIYEYITNKIDTKKVKIYEDNGVLKFSSASTFYMEEYSIKFLNEIKDKNLNLLNDIDYIIKAYSDIFEMLNEDQLKAVKSALSYNVSIITGKAGTGKTFVIQNLIKIFNEYGFATGLLAPTGKAAKRIEELTGFKAATIHRALRYNSQDFEFNEFNKLTDYDIIIVDEFSMVNNDLAYRLFSALTKEIKIILVGDHNQLPPIGPGLLFEHLLFNNKIDFHITELKKIVRQAGELKKNSTDILNGQFCKKMTPDWHVMIENDFHKQENIVEKLIDIYSNRDIYFDDNNVTDIQIICPMKKGICGVHYINNIIQETVQKLWYDNDISNIADDKKFKYYLHDRVIQNVNDYDIGVMNGTLGNIIYHNKNFGTLKINFDNMIIEYEKNSEHLDNVSLAYALTIHKTQGSEFENVIVVLHKKHHIMLNKNLLYTAVTRASKKVIVISEDSVIQTTLNNNNIVNKRTNFQYIINQL